MIRFLASPLGQEHGFFGLLKSKVKCRTQVNGASQRNGRERLCPSKTESLWVPYLVITAAALYRVGRGFSLTVTAGKLQQVVPMQIAEEEGLTLGNPPSPQEVHGYKRTFSLGWETHSALPRKGFQSVTLVPAWVHSSS